MARDNDFRILISLLEKSRKRARKMEFGLLDQILQMAFLEVARQVSLDILQQSEPDGQSAD